ncbi:5-oxoprolinase subunit PxpB [Wenyingzhuangia aestuarii]|uniref:5-oxoprolinase subunit PxpB n=1 Tax=Wenyingzhuangia aestuarii TaxID=1647582 RepID=UPI00143C96FC|nr:5-oxoprolinase subunit PxpB [Wenyingzhuangia aestuarii]NJB82764.1 inhibitor of KinA [Wenyingzhuangia aestuarii]
MQYDVITYGEKALLLRFKNEISLEVHHQVKSCYHYLKNNHIKGVVSLIPAYNSLTVLFDPDKIEGKTLKVFLENTPFQVSDEVVQAQKTVEIPVCYEEAFALDLQEVSEKLNVSIQEIIDIHTAQPYLVYMLGFAPGFMYLGGLDQRLHMPRKATPRLRIPAGAVGLADQQTGVYPLETPGGWQIIGQTPLELFSKEQPALVAMGDLVQFVPITEKEFYKIKKS